MVEKKTEKQKKQRQKGNFVILVCKPPAEGFSESVLDYSNFHIQPTGDLTVNSVADCESFIRANAEQFDGMIVRIIQLKKELKVTVKVKKIASF